MNFLIKPATLLLLITTSLFAQSGQTPATDQSTSGTITGRVVDQNGEPLPDALVSVRPFAGVGANQNAVSDRDGKFKVTGLPSVVYLASATLPAYTTAPRDPDSTQSTSYRVGDDITLVLIKGGVITGSVTSANGTPVVRIRVRAQMIRDANGQPSRYGASTREHITDDRGIYRIYGLPTGTYLVFTSGSTFVGPNSAYEDDAPTYAPASVRATAEEINVRAGEENTGVDIRHRGEPGNSVSGNVSGPLTTEPYGSSISLTATLDGGSQLRESIYLQPGSRGFVFNGVADGEYYITAESFLPNGVRGLSEPKRIKVSGADVANVELVTKFLPSISGRVVLEESKVEECKGKKRVLFTEILVSAWHNEKEVAKDQPQFIWGIGGPVTPSAEGEVRLRNLAPGQYQIIARQFAKYWYLRSISMSSATGAATRPNQTARDAQLSWINLRAGENRSGLVVAIAEGAATVRGSVMTQKGTVVPARMYVYLVPAERESAQDVLRYFAAPIGADNTIAFNNVAPGRYLVIMRPAVDHAGPTLTKLRLPDENETRARLRADAEEGKIELELKPCQNLLDYQLTFSPGKE